MSRPAPLVLASLVAPIPAAAAVGVVCLASWLLDWLTPYPTSPLPPSRALALMVATPAVYLFGVAALYLGVGLLSRLKLLHRGGLLGAACVVSVGGGICAAAFNALDSSDVLVYFVAFSVLGMLFTVPTALLWWRMAHDYALRPTASGGG